MTDADVETGIPNKSYKEENENIVLERCATPIVPELVLNNEKRRCGVARRVEPKPETSEQSPGTLDKLADFNEISTRFYPGDVIVKKEDVRLSDWEPLYGSVLKPVAGTEMARSPDKGSSSDFHVHWDLPNRIGVAKASEVSLVDRVLLLGQRVEDQVGNIGTIVDYEVSATVQINGTQDVVEKIPLHRLRPISKFVRGQEVLMKGWVGVITTVKRNIWFRLENGTVFYMETTESDGFTRTDPYWGLGVACPGMRTKLSSQVMKKAIWTSGPLRFFSKWLPIHLFYSLMYATIIETEVTQLEVKWLQLAPGATPASRPPSPIVSRKELNLRSILVVGTPSTETIGINSVRRLQLVENDNIVDYNIWLEGFKKTFVDGDYTFEYPTRNPASSPSLKSLVDTNDETPVKVLVRHNTVTVQWANGKQQKVPAINIPRVAPTADDGEFPMGLIVSPIQLDNLLGEKYGVVMESNDLARARSRKVNVRWIHQGKDTGIEQVSVFDIRPHTTYSMYQRGTIVFPRGNSEKPESADSKLFQSAVVVDTNVYTGKMVVIRSSDNLQDDLYPHQVVALARRCHWSFFSRTWVIDDMLLPPYQLSLDYDPLKKLVDVNEQNFDILEEDVNNPQEMAGHFNPIWDEPTFELLAFAPETHRYYNCSASERFGKGFASKIETEMEYLKEKGNIPDGIWVRFYENRLDLISVLMVGPQKTPYEDGLYLFDLQLPTDFPTSRPSVHYVSYTLEIHPMLSFDGNVCVSAIPWEQFSNEDEETPSSYISLFVQRLQAMIFTPTPYFCGHQKNTEEGTDRGNIKAQLYNHGVLIRVLDSTWNMLQKPHEPWAKYIRNHFATSMPERYYAIEKWINDEDISGEEDDPAYPLLPAPDGLKLALRTRVEMYKKLSKVPSVVVEIASVMDSTADSESFAVHQRESVDCRTLTPIAEITEPSSTSTFGAKVSSLTVPSDDEDFGSSMDPPVVSLDSLKNIKEKSKPKDREPKTTAMNIQTDSLVSSTD